MFAYRRTYMVKRGRMGEAVRMMSAQIERTTKEGQQIRLYIPDISPLLLVFESVHEDEEAHQEYWAELGRDQQTRSFHDKWQEVTERHVSTERWKVHQWR